MAVSFVAQATYNVNALTGNFTIPATTEGGDIIVVALDRSANEATPTMSPGTWTQLDATRQGSSLTGAIWWKKAAGTIGSASSDASTSITVTAATAGRHQGTITVWRGVDQTTPIDAAALAGFTTALGSASHPTPVVMSVNGGRVVDIVINKTSSAETDHIPPAGVTERSQILSGASGAPAMAQGESGDVAAATNTTSRTWTTGSGLSSQYIVGTIILRAATAAVTRVTKTHTTSWDVAQRATKTLSTTWDVAGSLTRVSKNHATSWDVRSRAVKTSATSWDVAALAPPGTAVHEWVGAVGPTGFTVKTRLTGATSVRLAVSTSSGMTSPTYVAAQTPDADGYVTHVVTGLNPETRYYFRPADTPPGGGESLVGTVGTIRTLQTVGAAITGTRKIVLGGCIETGATDQIALQSAIDWDPDWGVLNGDLTYVGSSTATTAAQRAPWENQINAVSKLKEGISKGLASMYLPSDHDCGVVDNGDSNNAFTASNILAWDQVVPHEPFLDPAGTKRARDHVRNDGRISFYYLDVRNTDRSTGSGTDNSAKTMLGAAQLARLLDWLANNPAKFKVIICDTAWMGVADIINKQDWWPAYTFERTTVANAINAAQVDGSHVEMWHGDSHLIGYATAAKNTWGNFPIICAAPYAQDGGGRNTNTFSAYFNNASAAAREYGRITFTDDGSTITRTFSGWDAITNTEKVADTVTFTPLARVVKTHATSWDVRARVAKAVATTYDVRQRFSKTSATSWDVRTRSTKTHATSWDVRSRAIKTLATSWDVAGSLTRIAKTHSTSWDVNARAIKTHATTYDVRTRAVKTSGSSWDVRQRLTKMVPTSWDVASLVAPSSKIKVWNGSAWVVKPVKVWNGVAWVVKPVKRWTGSLWAIIS